jgi:hypothetical protein
MKYLKELEVPLIWIYNIIMLEIKDMKKDLIIELNMIGEWWCRGERGIDDEMSCKVNVDKIRRVWDDRDEDGEVDTCELNEIEESIVWGDGGFCFDEVDEVSRGVEGCMSRVDDLLEGKSVYIELEEGLKCIGSIVDNELEIDFLKWKIELLEN